MPRKKTHVSKLTSAVFDRYRELFYGHHGERSLYKFSGKDRSGTSQIIREIGFIETMARLEVYFAQKDPWVEQRNHPYNIFITRIDQYTKKRGKYAKAKITKRDEAKREIQKFRARRKK